MKRREMVGRADARSVFDSWLRPWDGGQAAIWL
jgi:hypothetical protein